MSDNPENEYLCAVKWRIDHGRMVENSAYDEQITDGQMAYIISLSKRNATTPPELMAAINFNRRMMGLGLAEQYRALTKSEAMYFIKCMLGEIKPMTIVFVRSAHQNWCLT